jgi:hypothetical protein
MNKTALKNSLIELGSVNPNLRPAIRQVISGVEKKAGVSLSPFTPQEFWDQYSKAVVKAVGDILYNRYWLDTNIGKKPEGPMVSATGENHETGEYTDLEIVYSIMTETVHIRMDAPRKFKAKVDLSGAHTPEKVASAVHDSLIRSGGM